MSAFLALLKRDLRLAVRQGGALGTALGFYMLVVTLLPLGLGADLNLLSRIAPGVLWIALLLAALLSLGRVFSSDYEDGSLDVLATGSLPMELVVSAKALAHWISTGIPLALMAPVLGLLLNLDIGAYPLLVATMLVGTPAVSFIGAVGAALTLTGLSRRSPDRAAGPAALRADAGFRHGGDQRPARRDGNGERLPYSYRTFTSFSRTLPIGCGGGPARSDAVNNRAAQLSLGLNCTGGPPSLDHLQCRP